ncbi:MAG: hypothetical protein AAFV45_02995 [Pseudomonadota bacterium]
MWRHRKRPIAQIHDDTAEQARTGTYGSHQRGGGGLGSAFATIISAVALTFSGYSFYESVLRAPELAVFAPPRIDYTDPDRPDSPFEVFVIPLTIANDGARSGTVLSVDLSVTNPRSLETKRFYAAQLGTWQATPRKPFAPIVLAGKAAFSETVQFLPRNGETVARILDLEPGTYDFEVTLNTGGVTQPWPLTANPVQPLKFTRRIGQLDYRNFNGPGTMPMWSADYKPDRN